MMTVNLHLNEAHNDYKAIGLVVYTYEAMITVNTSGVSQTL